MHFHRSVDCDRLGDYRAPNPTLTCRARLVSFDFRGAWFGIGDRALHLIEQEGASRGAAAKLTRADHMALEVKDMDAVKEALESAEIPYQLGTNDRLGFRQIFCADPDGHTIEFISRG